MTAVLATLLVDGVTLTGMQHFLLMLPLCLSIAVIYKTMRCEDLRRLPVSALVLWVTIVLGMYAVGVGFWAAFTVLA